MEESGLMPTIGTFFDTPEKGFKSGISAFEPKFGGDQNFSPAVEPSNMTSMPSLGTIGDNLSNAVNKDFSMTDIAGGFLTGLSPVLGVADVFSYGVTGKSLADNFMEAWGTGTPYSSFDINDPASMDTDVMSRAEIEAWEESMTPEETHAGSFPDLSSWATAMSKQFDDMFGAPDISTSGPEEGYSGPNEESFGGPASEDPGDPGNAAAAGSTDSSGDDADSTDSGTGDSTDSESGME